MLTGQQQPLAIAATVLKPATMEAVRRSPSFHLAGWKILDRWAFNDPQKLRDLEARNSAYLMIRLLEQQTLEHDLLTSDASLNQRQNGLADHEILALNEINTEL